MAIDGQHAAVREVKFDPSSGAKTNRPRHTVPMRANKQSKPFGASRAPGGGRLASINQALNFKRPFRGVFAARQRFVYILPLSPNPSTAGC